MMIRPRNWKSFQHYKGRKPPWIKLHRGLLDDYEFNRLPLASKALAPLLWLLASESESGSIHSDPGKLAFRLRMPVEEVDAGLNPLIAAGFFEVVDGGASGTLASRKQHACLERETETETEGERDARAHEVSHGTQDAGDGLTRTPQAEAVLAEMNEAWREVDGVNVEALAWFFAFVEHKISPASKRRCYSPSARISLAKRLAGMGDLDHQAAVVEQSRSCDHAVLYPLKDRPSKHGQEAAKRVADERRELAALEARAAAVKFRASHRGEDPGDYRVAVERAERDAKEADYRAGLAKRQGVASVADLLKTARGR